MYDSDVGLTIAVLLIGVIGGALIGSLIGAIVLSMAAKWVAKLNVCFGKAYWTFFIDVTIIFMLDSALTLGIAYLGSIGAAEWMIRLSFNFFRYREWIRLPVHFLLSAAIIGWRLAIPFGKACLVNLVTIAMGLGIVLAVALIIMLGTGSWPLTGFFVETDESVGTGGIAPIPDDEMRWVKCNAEWCKAEYEMRKKEYYSALTENLNLNLVATDPMAITCERCGNRSLHGAIKCTNPHCRSVFREGISGPDYYPDRCPDCGKSEMEEMVKRRMSGRR